MEEAKLGQELHPEPTRQESNQDDSTKPTSTSPAAQIGHPACGTACPNRSNDPAPPAAPRKKPPPHRQQQTMICRPEAPRCNPAPALLLWSHIEKTGGTTLKGWLAHNALSTPRGMPQRLDYSIEYSGAHCLLALFPDVFPSRRHERNCNVAPHVLDNRVKAPTLAVDQLDWRRLRLAVEFHDVSHSLFWTHVAPNLDALLARYRALNGSLVTATLLRDPLAYLISVFRYFPPVVAARPREGGLRNGSLVPFASWVRHADGLQLGRFALNDRAPYSWHGIRCFAMSTAIRHRTGFFNRRGCVDLTAVLANLRAFDIVGVTSCLPAVFAAIEHRLGMAPVDSAACQSRRMREANGHLLHISPRGASRTFRSQLVNVTWAHLNHSTRRLALEVVRKCDARLYEHAEARALSELAPFGCVAPRRRHSSQDQPESLALGILGRGAQMDPPTARAQRVRVVPRRERGMERGRRRPTKGQCG